MQGEHRTETQAGNSSAGDSQDAFSGDLPTNRQDAAKTSSSAGRLLPAVFLAFVVACLVVPLLETLHPFLRTIVEPVDEHRTANAFPSPWLLLHSNGDFADGLNKWFDDRVGFRDLFIRTKNQIDYSVFSTSRKVFVGSDGWLFERDPGLPLERLDAAGFDALKGRFLSLVRRLGEKNIRLVLVGYPDKSRIYPDALPADGRLLLPGGNYDKLRQFLSSQESLIFIDVEQILQRERPNTTDPVYLKTDLHASATGQVAVSKEIIARIAQAEGRGDIRWNEKFKRATNPWEAGNEARFLAPLLPVIEDVASLTGTYVVGGEEPTGRWIVSDRRDADRADEHVAPLFLWEFESNPEFCNKRFPATVMWGNSFADLYSALGVHRYFCSFRRLPIMDRRNTYDHLDGIFEKLPHGTKYFIFQYYTPIIQYSPFLTFTPPGSH